MARVEVFDPPMCCSTGVCGANVDPALALFASDLGWLEEKGVTVKRYSLSQQPKIFARNAVVKAALAEHGNDGLPFVVIDGKMVSHGRHPSRVELASWTGLAAGASVFTAAVGELVAIGAAIASNCEPCFRYHYSRARKLGVSRDDMMRAVKVARTVREAPARAVLELAEKYLKNAGTEVGAACSPCAKKPGRR